MYVNVNGVKIYYEVCGAGRPLILVHGNGEDHNIFDVVTERLKERFTVYSMDSRCHGQSQNTRTISYDQMADDVIGFIRELNLEKPIYYGFSDGGITGIKVAVKEPEILEKLIVSGANLYPSGMKKSMLLVCRVVYFFTKSELFRMMLTQPNMEPTDLKAIKVPTHVLAGERDLVLESHTRLIAESIEGSTLEILKGEKHGTYVVHSPKLYGILEKYLRA